MVQGIHTLLKGVIIIGAGYGCLDQMGLFQGTFDGQQLLYYTILSNLIIFSSYAINESASIWHSWKGQRLVSVSINPNLMGALTAMILVTGIVYHLILIPALVDTTQYGLNTISNFLVHTFVPVAVLLDWIFFYPLEDVRALTPVKWLLIPFGYWLLALAYATSKVPFFNTDSYYAYFFIDVDQLGWVTTIRNVVLFALFFLALGFFLKGIKYHEAKYIEK